MQQKMRKTLVVLALLGAALLNYPRPGRGGTASGAYSQAAKNAYGGRDTAYPEYEETSRDKAPPEPTNAEKNLAACTFFGFEANCEQDRSALKTFLRQWYKENHPDKFANPSERSISVECHTLTQFPRTQLCSLLLM